jgi:hypothetical protein
LTSFFHYAHHLNPAFCFVLVIALLAGLRGARDLFRLRGDEASHRPMPVEFFAAKDGNVARLEEALADGFAINTLSSEGVSCLQVNISV